MIYRGVLILLTGFWVTMNVLLWRAEYGQPDPAGSAVPADLVWQKILTAPDSSSLTIYHHRKKVGFCHWITSIGEDLSLSLIHISEPTRLLSISYAVFFLKK